VENKEVIIINKMHHPKADINRIYVEMKGGGRGLLQTEVTYKAEMVNIAD
jgi:hypothetical protein